MLLCYSKTASSLMVISGLIKARRYHLTLDTTGGSFSGVRLAFLIVSLIRIEHFGVRTQWPLIGSLRSFHGMTKAKISFNLLFGSCPGS